MTHSRLLAVSLCTGLLAGAGSTALADTSVTVPFKATASVTEMIDPRPGNPCGGEAPAYGSAATGYVNGSGVGSVIGAFSFTAMDCITSTTVTFDPPFAFASREFMITTGSGEQIMGRYSGTGMPQSAQVLSFSGTFTITGGSGRFAKTTGSGTLQVIEDISTMPAKGFMTLTGRITPPRR